MLKHEFRLKSDAGRDEVGSMLTTSTNIVHVVRSICDLAVVVVGQSRMALNQRVLAVTGRKQNHTNSPCLLDVGTKRI